MPNSNALLTCNQKSPVKLHCEVNLHKLFVSPIEKERFESKWEAFLTSDPSNNKIFKLRKHNLFYELHLGCRLLGVNRIELLAALNPTPNT